MPRQTPPATVADQPFSDSNELRRGFHGQMHMRVRRGVRIWIGFEGVQHHRVEGGSSW